MPQSNNIDERPIVDPELEWEVDRSGMIHVRKHPGETEVLPGYGTTDFGISAYETKPSSTNGFLLAGAGIAAAGGLVWKFRNEITEEVEVLATYALLMREYLKDEWNLA